MPVSVFLLTLVVAQPPEPPRALTCLSSWYAGSPTWTGDGGWALELPSGELLPWSTKDGPWDPDAGVSDLEEIFEPPYVSGPIVPIDVSDAGTPEDPGRIRVEQLFRATYGGTLREVSAQLAKVRFFGLSYPFHRRAAGALERVVTRLTPAVKADPSLLRFLTNIGGTWHWRRIARSPSRSAHAWGIAIDLNVERANYWRWRRRHEPLVWKNRIPQTIVDAFEAEGFIWGGRWKHFDTMHFEFRPELLSKLCR